MLPDTTASWSDGAWIRAWSQKKASSGGAVCRKRGQCSCQASEATTGTRIAPELWRSWSVITSPVVLLSWLVLTLEQNRWEVPAMLQHVHHHFWLNSRSSSWSNGRRNQEKVRRNGYWRDQECRDLETQRSWDGQNFPHSSRLPIMLLQLGKLWSQLVFEVVMRSSSLSLLSLPKEHVPQRSCKLPERR